MVQLSKIRLVVVSAGINSPSSSRFLADALARETVMVLAIAGQSADITVIELRNLFCDIAAAFTSPASEDLRLALDTVAAADALMIVTPVLASSYSGMFKAFFELLERGAIAGIPTVVAATGGSLRHSLVLEHAMRPLFTYLRAAVVPTGVFATATDWANHEASEALLLRVQRAALELAEPLRSSLSRG